MNEIRSTCLRVAASAKAGEIRNSKQFQMTKSQMFETDKNLGILSFEDSILFRIGP
jgi:hypothetical protein